MPELDWLPLLFKAGSTALLVVAAARVSEVVGPLWGAVVVTLPVSAGPALLFLAMRHDAAFLADTVLASAAGNAATAVFLVAYARLARLPLWLALSLAITAWAATCGATRLVGWDAAGVALLNLAVFGAGFLIAPVPPPATGAAKPAERGRFDLAIRAAAVAVLVCVVVTGSDAMGPTLTGFAAVFPISLTSTLAIVRPRIGVVGSVILATTALRAMLGFGMALLATHLAIGPFGVPVALTLGLVLSVLWSLGMRRAFRR